MIEPSAEDLLAVDRDVARAAGELARWRADLATDAARDLERLSAREDPFEYGRHVAGKSTWDALGRMSLGPAESLHRDALRRWNYALIQARVGLVFDVAIARAKGTPKGHLGGPAPRLVSFVEAWRGVIGSTNVGQASEWLVAAADASPEHADLGRRRAGRRVEVARRLGLDHPWSPLVAVVPEALNAQAMNVLNLTDDIWRHVHAESSGPQPVAAAVIQCAVARDAGEGWPGQLSMQWLANVTGIGANAVELDVQSLPANVGAASFLRALYSAGFEARVALGRSGLPFSLAQEPMFVSAHRWALAFASLGTDIDWQMRELGVGRRAASAQVRRLACSALFELRLQAARVLVGDPAAPATTALFEELGVRLVGLPLDRRLRGAWPTVHDDDPARLLAWAQAPHFVAHLRDSFDLDWYRNPRAWAHLRDLAARPAREAIDADALDKGVRALARAFEVALG
jgi:hypothetical protein